MATTTTTEIRVRTDRTRSGDDGETVCTVLAGTEGTVVSTRPVTNPLHPAGDRMLLLTVAWDVALLNPDDDDRGDCVTTFWEEADIPQDAVKFAGVVRTEQEAAGAE